MKKSRVVIILFAAGMILCQVSCLSLITGQSSKKSKPSQEVSLEKEAADNPNSAKAQYDWGRRLYKPVNDYVQAAAVWERALAIDPKYRVSEKIGWTRQTASTFGVMATENIMINDFSLYYFLGVAYYDGVKEKKFEENDRTDALEKCLAAFRKGYEIDITGGKNNNIIIKTHYIGSMAKVLDLLNRQKEATDAYIELSKIARVSDEISYRISAANFSGPSYYVSAKGNNNNDGLSDAAPMRSLSLAFQKACAGNVKRIIVIGTLNYQSEAGSSDSEVFYLDFPKGVKDESEILITGRRWGAEKAVLSGTGSKKRVVNVNEGKVRFENIEVSGGELNDKNEEGSGISFSSGTGTIGRGAVIRANKGPGVNISWNGGSCTLAGGEIRDNENGGVVINMLGTFTMTGGTITGNKRTGDGGGVAMYSSSTFTMSGGTITGNTATEGGGGINILLGNFTMSGGSVTKNKAKDGGGINVSVSIDGDSNFTMTGGSVTENIAVGNGGGVYVAGVREELGDNYKGGIFKQSGGSITGNTAIVAGGVFVMGSNGRYDKTGGTVIRNEDTHYFPDAIAGSNSNITRMKGSLGSGWW